MRTCPVARAKLAWLGKFSGCDVAFCRGPNLTFHHKAEMIFQDIAEFFFANGQKGYESAFLKVTVITLT